MKRYSLIMILGVLLAANSVAQDIYKKENVKELMERVNTYQFKHPWQEYDDNWIRGTYYAGVMACYLATEDEQFLTQSENFCESLKWSLPAGKAGSEGGGGNLLTCGQTMLECYFADKKKSKIENIITHLDNPELKTPIGQPLTWHWEQGRMYVDAIFTGPPTLAMLYKATKDERYLQWMDHFVWSIYGRLYDEKENLFYRDVRFRNEAFQKENVVSNKKVIWSRGNGWAIAGIARILQYLPEDHGSYTKYEMALQDMACALKACQSEEGFWYPNLVDPDYVRLKETSGTSFFIYGLAYGVNNGILDKEEYLPVIKKAWKSVCDEISDEGKVQWGQVVGDQPVNLSKDDSHEYVSGTFLLAASEIYKTDFNK